MCERVVDRAPSKPDVSNKPIEKIGEVVLNELTINRMMIQKNQMKPKKQTEALELKKIRSKDAF